MYLKVSTTVHIALCKSENPWADETVFQGDQIIYYRDQLGQWH
jgi:hypothetical protein